LKISILIGISLLFGVIAAVLVAHLSKSINPASGGREQVVIATASIQAGAELTDSQLQVMNWPNSFIPGGSFSALSALKHRVARQPIEAGELILESKLAVNNSKAGLTAIIAQGKRAISVRVNDVIAVAGFTLPGNFVDVMVSAKDEQGKQFSKIVLNHVKILAIAQDTSAEPNKPKVVNAVTLELAPEEAEQLDLARSIGALSLVLRNEMDSAQTNTTGAHLMDLTHVDLVETNAVDAASTKHTEPQTQAHKAHRSSGGGVTQIRGVNEATGAE